MPILLHIETSTDICSIALSQDDRILSVRESKGKNEHASMLATYISEVSCEANIPLNKINAVVVGKGPGSYTGLRIGVSTAKGLCYAIGKPLIAISPLQAMASIVAKDCIESKNTLFCPMIDAGRMEVYAAVYDGNMKEIRAVQADIVDLTIYAEYLNTYKMIFMGNGSDKCKELLSSFENAVFFDEVRNSATHMLDLALIAYKNKDFVNLAYFEPFYLKDFIAGKSIVKGLR